MISLLLIYRQDFDGDTLRRWGDIGSPTPYFTHNRAFGPMTRTFLL